MAMTYQTLTGLITEHGSNVGIRGKVHAIPMTTGHALSFADENRLTLGVQTAETSSNGTLAQLKIPTNHGLPDLYWRLEFERINPVPGQAKRWVIKNAAQFTGTGTIDITDVVEIDTIMVDAQILVNLSDLVTDAENARDDAEGSQVAAADSASAAAGSATSASGSASAAASSATTASGAATTAQESEANAADSATTASDAAGTATTKAGEASDSADAASASKTAAQGYAAQAAGSVSLVAWAPTTAYAAGDVRQAPDGSTIKRTANGTSRASFDATEEAAWTAVAADGTTIVGKALTASMAQLTAWAKDPDNLVAGALTYSGGLLASAAVVWPDGATGTLTITSRQSGTDAITGYTITRVVSGQPAKTYTQPTITRDSSGNATTVPQITVA